MILWIKTDATKISGRRDPEIYPMSKQEKALQRLASVPKDFTWAELVTLMTSLSFQLEKAGGSGRKFVHTETGATLFLHQPHPGRILKPYQVRDAIYLLKSEGFL